MIVNYENDPKNSIIYTAGVILSYIKGEMGIVDYDVLYKYCQDKNMEYSIFILTIDWMFLVGLIIEVNDRNEVVFCS